MLFICFTVTEDFDNGLCWFTHFLMPSPFFGSFVIHHLKLKSQNLNNQVCIKFLCLTFNSIPNLVLLEAISALLISPAFSTSSAGDRHQDVQLQDRRREFSGWKSSNSWTAGSVSSQQPTASDFCSINPPASQILSYFWVEYLHWFL